MLCNAFTTREAFLLPATPASRAETLRAEFVDSVEATCHAETAYAAEDANDLAALATSLRSFLVGAKAKLSRLNYGKASAADLELMADCLAEQIEDVLTAEAAAYFRAELANREG